MIDPSEYADKQVLVVGGGDSALEAANAIAEEPGSVVTLSYRSGSFSRAKRKNRQKSESLAEAGKLNILFNSNVKNISEEKVVIGTKNENLEIGNDAVIVCVGGILPTGFLNEIGIEVETKYGVA
jgi:thioredoxin reductase